MRILLSLTILSIVTSGYAQTPIDQARNLPVGTSVTVRGIVTNGSEFGSIRYVQDATGGLALFPGTGSIGGFSPAPGTDITVTGTVKDYFGLLELDPISAFTINSTGNALPSAQVISPSQLGESVECELIRVNNCTFDNAGGTFASGTGSFSSNGQSGIMYLRTGHPLIGTSIPLGAIDLVAIVSQYTTSTPALDGYQLLPRNSGDLIASNTITITSPITQTNIVPDGFTLFWTTNLAGTSNIAYGTTPALGSFTSSTGTTTDHSVALNGLQPAAFYYARCFSVLGTDTAWSTTTYYSTASTNPGSVAAYFNHSVDNSVATISPAISLGNLIDDTVRAYIDRAEQTLEYAVYNTTTTGIATSLNNAYDRGVQIRIVAEASNSNSALNNLNAAIPILFRQDAQGSGMHHKFMVIDADDPNNAFTMSGSTNYTNGSFYTDANNLVVIEDQALARCYRMEFDEMWGGSGAQPNLTNSKFGPDKTDNTPHFFNVGGTLIESSFSPSDGTTARIDDALRTTDATVEFALFAFTMNSLVSALTTVDALPGRTVRGIMETDDMDMGVFQDLFDGGVDVRPDGDPDSYLHHKYAIVDRAGGTAADPLVITGSHNWSYNAETLNDENTLIIHNATIADHFYQEWAARWTLAVGVDETSTGALEFNVWPNPSRDQCTIQFESLHGGLVHASVLDATGRMVINSHVFASPGMNQITMDIQGTAPGTYIIQIEGNSSRGHKVLVKE